MTSLCTISNNRRWDSVMVEWHSQTLLASEQWQTCDCVVLDAKKKKKMVHVPFCDLVKFFA